MGSPATPAAHSQKKLHALPADALNEQVVATVDGERRKITKREAVVHQLINKSATADLRRTKMLFDMIKDVEQKASITSPAPELRTSPARRSGRGGGAKSRRPDTTANPAPRLTPFVGGKQGRNRKRADLSADRSR